MTREYEDSAGNTKKYTDAQENTIYQILTNQRPAFYLFYLSIIISANERQEQFTRAYIHSLYYWRIILSWFLCWNFEKAGNDHFKFSLKILPKNIDSNFKDTL